MIELGVIVAGMTIVGGVVKMAGFLKKVSRMLDAFIGYPPGPGYPGQAGVIERLTTIENEIAKIKERVEGLNDDGH